MTKIRSLLVAILVVVLVGGFFVATGPYVPPTTTTSSVSGLATLKGMAKQSVPFPVALANGKPTLLEFYANWCSTCQFMAPSLEKLHDKYGEQVNFVMLDVDDPQFEPQLLEYDVNGLPQITFLSANATDSKTLVGMIPERAIAQNLEQLIINH